MLIRDLEEKTGLNRATIRFYEKEGLIDPQRKENGYRQYSQEHLSHLIKIKLLRQLGMSLDTIKALQQGREDFGVALSNHIQMLEQQIDSAEKAKIVCSEMRKTCVKYDTLDAQYYMELLEKEPSAKTDTAFQESLVRQYHPARRFFARFLDYLLLEILLELILIVFIRVRPYGAPLTLIIKFAIPFASVIISSVLLRYFGTTPGKWLFGLSVRSENGNLLTYNAAFNRECGVLQWGYGYGLPVYSIIRLIMSGISYKSQDPPWDNYSEYCYHSWTRKRKMALVATIIVLLSVTSLCAISLTKPQHCGALTIEEFSDNYNFYYEILEKSPNSYDCMQTDGTWKELPNTVVEVYPQAKPMYPRQNFQYEMDDSYISSVKYENTWTEVRYLEPLQPECITALTTIVMSQRGMGLIDIYRIAQKLGSAQLDDDGQISHENIQIIWKIDSQNCTFIDGAFRPDVVLDKINSASGNTPILIETEDTVDSSVSITWEIKIHN